MSRANALAERPRRHPGDWPTIDAQRADYAYAFDGGTVYASCFGYGWFIATEDDPSDDDSISREKTAVFPQMDKSKYAQAGSKGSGVMVFTAPQ